MQYDPEACTDTHFSSTRILTGTKKKQVTFNLHVFSTIGSWQRWYFWKWLCPSNFSNLREFMRYVYNIISHGKRVFIMTLEIISVNVNPTQQQFHRQLRTPCMRPKAVTDFFPHFWHAWSSTLATHQPDCIPDWMSGRRPDSFTMSIRVTHLSYKLNLSSSRSLLSCWHDVRATRVTGSPTIQLPAPENTTRVHLSPTSFRPFLFHAHHQSPRPPSAPQSF